MTTAQIAKVQPGEAANEWLNRITDEVSGVREAIEATQQAADELEQARQALKQLQDAIAAHHEREPDRLNTSGKSPVEISKIARELAQSRLVHQEQSRAFTEALEDLKDEISRLQRAHQTTQEGIWQERLKAARAYGDQIGIEFNRATEQMLGLAVILTRLQTNPAGTNWATTPWYQSRPDLPLTAERRFAPVNQSVLPSELQPNRFL